VGEGVGASGSLPMTVRKNGKCDSNTPNTPNINGKTTNKKGLLGHWLPQKSSRQRI